MGGGVEDFALPGQHHGTAGAGEQGHTHNSLQLLDLMADCGRGHPQVLGGAGEVQVGGGSIKGTQRAKAGE